MKELVANVKGPSEWFCKDGIDCWYNEYSTLVSVFPDNIRLNCDVGECANEQDYLDVHPIEREFSQFTETVILSAIVLACIVMYIVVKVTARRQQRMFGSRIELDNYDESEAAAQEMEMLEDMRKEVLLTFDDICYTVGGKNVLSGISGYVEPGELLAVMGPSGAGKSSLLDILARKHKRGVASGSIMVNGVVPTRRRFKQLSGFVDQDDTLMGTLTVRETLMYAASLRLPRKMSVRLKQKRVADVIHELGLEAIADSPIGTPGQRGISGGEKRRVSIGKELVTSPSLLFLDEPTSGLDAFNAGVVMECLRKLSKQGRRTVVVTIHQPRSNIFKMFDSLMLLAGGHTVSDTKIDLTMKRPEDADDRPDDRSFSLPRSRASSITSTQQLDDLRPSEESRQLISDTVREMNSHEPQPSSEFTLLSESNHAYHLIESYRSSNIYSAVRSKIRQSSNNNSTNNARYSVLFWQVGVDLSGVQNRLGVLFFMCALLGFASTSALDMFSRERVLFMRERENGYYSPASYFCAKVLFDIVPLRVLPPLVMGSLSYYMVGLNPALPVFGKFLLVLVLFNLAAAGVCLCFATAFKNVSAANLLASLVMLFSMLFGGFLLNKDHIPGILNWLKYLSFFNYGYEALIVNELKDITLRDKSIADIQIPGPVILARFGFNGQAFWADVVRLCLFAIITLSTSFVFLKYLVKERR
ncbi:P-loop containing nucleoside triphosphate hydrolase protein [Zychaea mexicana]|uniref:P-loop containing nucleoside triphosphate hydrolase protein n=1 Tax=Zychaea mexicana TaxID=64656 RepID=UPI0022FE8F54|nr:P-loop containing nucleoside triphosphate hydrolase protein [Zychaea mexicana]KAI9492910.1 P-loop containing nucleoside triphosphate hydrolase protein [Zychaea mexicana]